MKIIFVTDYVCPYCIVSKEAMTRALQDLDMEADIETIPFELTPMDRPQVDTWNDEVRRSHYTVLDEPVKKLGMDLHIPPQVVPRPYTHYAFEGYHYADEHGCGEAYSNACYLAYFRDEKDIGSIDVLTGIAKECGLDEVEFRDVLNKHIFSNAVDADNELTKNGMQIKHVPTIFIDGEELQGGAYTVEEWKDILLYKASASSLGGCGPDGCGDDGCGPDGCK